VSRPGSRAWSICSPSGMPNKIGITISIEPARRRRTQRRLGPARAVAAHRCRRGLLLGHPEPHHGPLQGSSAFAPRSVRRAVAGPVAGDSVEDCTETCPRGASFDTSRLRTASTTSSDFVGLQTMCAPAGIEAAADLGVVLRVRYLNATAATPANILDRRGQWLS
jgi:hypothetical protein